MTALYQYIENLPAAQKHPEYVEKRIRARDLVAHLPAPANLRRDLRIVPDIDIKLILSLTGAQPAFIKEMIANSEQRDVFKQDSLMGLCFSGLGASPEIFLNIKAMWNVDHTGMIIDEVTWHEYMHAMEGVEKAGQKLTRETPWSFTLQQTMLEMDEKADHISWLRKGDLHADFKKYATYLREGTSLQDNASEVFARVGVLFFNSIAQTGDAPTRYDGSYYNPGDVKTSFNIRDRKQYNMNDLLTALSTFSKEAQQYFWDNFKESLDRVALLYGCQPMQPKDPSV